MDSNQSVSGAEEAVFVKSQQLPEGTPQVQGASGIIFFYLFTINNNVYPMYMTFLIFTGYDWNKGVNYHELFNTYKYAGFQATNFGLAIDEINRMVI